jgi:hypothetical protein
MHSRIPKEWCNGRKAASGTALFEAAVPCLIDASPQHLDEIAARGLRINIAD